MSDYLSLSGLGGLGVGSVLNSAANCVIAGRAAERGCLYVEKREIYLGSLDAL